MIRTLYCVLTDRGLTISSVNYYQQIPWYHFGLYITLKQACCEVISEQTEHVYHI